MGKWLEFKEVVPEKIQKTKILEVYNKVTGDYLGKIHWKPSWRQYVFDDDTLEIGKSCMQEFIEMFDKLEKLRLN